MIKNNKNSEEYIIWKENHYLHCNVACMESDGAIEIFLRSIDVHYLCWG